MLLEPLLDHGTGADLVAALRSVRYPPAIAVVSRSLDNERELEFKSKGVEICLRKPMQISELRQLMSALWRSNRDVTAVTAFCVSWASVINSNTC